MCGGRLGTTEVECLTSLPRYVRYNSKPSASEYGCIECLKYSIEGMNSLDDSPQSKEFE